MRMTVLPATALLVLCLLALVALPTEAAAQRGATRLQLAHEGNIIFPQLSPDGTRVAYEVNFPSEKRTELWMAGISGMSVAGSPSRLVPESMASSSRYGAGKRITHGFSWAQSGPYAYAYSVSDASGAQAIYVDNWSEMVASGDSANKNPSWDPKEARFVFSSGRSGNGDLYLWDAGEPLQLTYDERNAELYPIFSADGQKVAYVRQGKSGSHIFLLDVNLFSSQPVVQYEGKESTRPSFSPDGSKIAFFSNKATESVTKFGLWVVDVRPGSTPRNIAPRVYIPSKGTASWTPDGRGVIAVADSPDAGDPICIYPVDGGPAKCLDDLGTRNNRDPQLRVLDGQWRLLYTSQSKAGQDKATWMELYVYDIPR